MSDPPSVFVLGAGPVGRALAGALRVVQIPVLGIWARRSHAAQEAGVETCVQSYSGPFPPQISDADILIVAVRDDAISIVAQTLFAQGVLKPTQVLLHCSGASAAERVFDGLADVVAGVGTLHPLRAIQDSRIAMESLAGITFGIEGCNKGRLAAISLCTALRGRALILESSQMSGYHTAAAIVSNFAVALFDMSQAILLAEGIDTDIAMPALCDLAIGAIENVRRDGLPQALTGPVRRGDVATVERHLKMLRVKCPELVSAYCILGQRTVEIAQKSGDLRQSQAIEFKELLQKS